MAANMFPMPVVELRLQARLFPALDAARRAFDNARPPVRAAIARVRQKRFDRLKRAQPDRPFARGAIIDAMKLSESDIDAVEESLQALDASDALAVWRRDAGAINAILDTYGANRPPRYPEIDSSAFGPNSEELNRLVIQLRLRALQERTLPPWDAIAISVTLLDAQGRDDAVWAAAEADHLNQAALGRSAHLDWRRYRYAAIVLPGQGPERLDEQLSSLSKFRLSLGAARLHQAVGVGEAPFLILSGGAVHPDRTSAVEAFRMRDWLIAQYNVPPDRIVVDPFARHTTTNLRNAARLLRRLGAPEGMPLLVSSDSEQVDAIASDAFSRRVLAELGCTLGRIGPRTDTFAIEYRPSAECLPPDPRDPLDP